MVFVVATLRPEWLPAKLGSPGGVMPGIATRPTGQSGQTADSGTNAARTNPILSYSDAAARATPAVVNIYTSKESRIPPDHPFLNDPLYKRYLGEQQRSQPTSSL